MKIIINNRRYSVRINQVTGFCTSAHIRIGKRSFDSKDMPYDFTANAIDNLLSRVQEVYPTARAENDN